MTLLTPRRPSSSRCVEIIERGLVMFGEILDVRAHEFRHTPQIGRTHGIHAEPITFGLKIANWFAENQRNIARFRAAAAQMAVGKISGAVGIAPHISLPKATERRWPRRLRRRSSISHVMSARSPTAPEIFPTAICAAAARKRAMLR